MNFRTEGGLNPSFFLSFSKPSYLLSCIKDCCDQNLLVSVFSPFSFFGKIAPGFDHHRLKIRERRISLNSEAGKRNLFNHRDFFTLVTAANSIQKERQKQNEVVRGRLRKFIAKILLNCLTSDLIMGEPTSLQRNTTDPFPPWP